MDSLPVPFPFSLQECTLLKNAFPESQKRWPKGLCFTSRFRIRDQSRGGGILSKNTTAFFSTNPTVSDLRELKVKFTYILMSPQRDRVLRGSVTRPLEKKRRWPRIVGCSISISSKPVAMLHNAAHHLGATRYKRNDFFKSVSLL